MAQWLAERLSKHIQSDLCAQDPAFMRRVLAEQTFENWASDGEMGRLLAMMRVWEAMAGMAKDGLDDIKTRTQALPSTARHLRLASTSAG